MTPSAPLMTAAALTLQRQMRFNPLRSLDPLTLSWALDNFNAGYLTTAAQLWIAMIERDDTLISVEPKRRDAIKSKTWSVEVIPGADATEAARHKAALEYFYNHLTTVNAYDRNEAGELELLIEQMMSAVAMRYAVHHIVWKLSGKTTDTDDAKGVPAVTAELEFVPLFFFENTTGTLRYDKTGLGVLGEELKPREWMKTTGRGIMTAASVAYMFKRLSFHDWTIFNERYAQGKVLGRTPAPKGSPEGDAMEETVAAFNGDMAAVIYNDSMSEKAPIEVIGISGTASPDAFAKFVERQDRKMAAMFRGSDLGTMSAGDGEGTGASLQGEETKVIERGDCSMIGGTCRRNLDRAVIAICFGEGTQPLAYFRLEGEEIPKPEDVGKLRESAGFLADRGQAVDAKEIAARLNVPLLSEKELGEPGAILGKASAPALMPPAFTANATTGQDIAKLKRETIAAMMGVRSEAIQPLLKRVIALADRAAEMTAEQIAAEVQVIANEFPALVTPELVAQLASPFENSAGALAVEVAAGSLKTKQLAKQQNAK